VSDTPQQALEHAARARGVSLSALSRMLGRNVAYLQQFVGRGSPRRLPERERRLLADFLGLDERVLGAPEPVAADVPVPRRAVSAAAGAGREPADERALRDEQLPRAWLRAHGVTPGQASLIDVTGNSMAPTLLDGDRLVVNEGDRTVPPGGGVFVIRVDDGVAVKRVRRSGATIEIVSDNPAYPALVRPAAEVTVIGRARLLLRDL
jgi:phage repressor protein C with HTH and peptisase S24 domain